ISNDVRTLTASDEPAAALAMKVYVHRIVREIGAIAAEIGGLDGLIFTGGVGEKASGVRAAICERLAFLGVNIDPTANAHRAARLSGPSSIPVLIVPANEEAVIAEETNALCAQSDAA
ncbi:MAG: acetate kinase, partial [Pseudomonadota bacterium]